MPNENQQSLLAFWGKAHPVGDVPAHPLAYHALDVAAVAECLLAADPARRAALTRALGVQEDDGVRLLVALAALHDMGKASVPFQAKVPEHRPECLTAHPVQADPGHDSAGWLWFTQPGPNRLLRRLAPIAALNELLRAAFGHHGRPPRQDRVTGHRARNHFPPESVRAANTLTEWVVARLGPAQTLAISTDTAKRAALAVAGLIAVADWIGSAQRWFAYTPPDHDLDTYWRDIARPRAEQAVRESGVVPAPSACLRPFYALARLPEGNATPLQRWAETVALPDDGPVLCLLEDLTGSGKTEAALMLAHRLMAAGRAGGLYLALPTQATANAMFDRLGDLYRNLFLPEAEPSLALAHGDRSLHPGFRAAILPANPDEHTYGEGAAQTVADVPAGAQCAAWIADDRRLAFLADVGAGTVDQALLSVLPARHTGLRRWGLLGKVLILDEIHAYDAYVGEEIAALIEAHTALGGHTILLSATLPADVRDKLADAFRRGAGLPGSHPGEQDPEAVPYPAGTMLGQAARTTHHVPAWSRQARRLPVRTLPTPAEALDEAEAAARAGQAVLVMRNTVDDATTTHDALRDRGLSPLLFHARFALGDRLAIEAEVMRLFGRDSRPDDRAGAILVATQVVEQSLDVDFDALFTDLAPIDLLIQRAGRLWRHPRPWRAGAPELVVVSPPPVADPDETWVRALLPGTAAVYRNHDVLWRTARLLEAEGAFDLPDRARALIEYVYGLGALTPEALLRSSNDAEGQAMAGRAQARANVLPLSAGYSDSHHWEPDHRIRTRDADDPAILRLGRWQDGVIHPWVDPDPDADRPPAIAWRLSQVSWRLQRLARTAWAEPDPALKQAADVARQSWGRWERDLPLVVLRPDGQGGWTGEARDDKGQPLPIRYCARLGLGLA